LLGKNDGLPQNLEVCCIDRQAVCFFSNVVFGILMFRNFKITGDSETRSE